ncbi:exodeoxyribonuclease V subunit beta [Salinisphaera sp. Q1T1-3]|uniref:exodeoxyribonuclease V subunit beta n=1 Tax=Salinisphaera sp. Q1T1-3 TaxID=2321229 RepID=UPI000E7357E3|nr:exodeoxyribonuclease V subunit beta [Salinisphaera sp. Q1T1-3]RJS91048.1 exodeoxyribonuclease V subunit beta [Salinisphaera sp. Q1T1-3]
MTRPAPHSQPFDAATLPLHGLRLIEASAGTGKTFSLAGLYLRLIVEQRVSVREVLVMTFTRAATQELRERIRARLAQAARIAHDTSLARPGHPEDDFTRRILDGVTEDSAALARRLADAAARVDEATIVTIHGFAQRAATENAFESALAFDRGDAVDDPQIAREAAADYWRAHVFGAAAEAGDMLALWPDPDALYRTVQPILAKPHARLAGLDPTRLAALQDALAEHWPGTAEPLAEALVSAFEADALLKGGDLYKALAAEDDIAASVADLDVRITAALAADTAPILPEWLLALADPGPQFKKAAKHQAHADPLAALSALPILIELQPLAKCVAIDTAAKAVAERAEARKIDRRQYSYDDLIVALHAALTHPRTGDTLAAALRARWPYALVDEFQDTDPLQYASLSRIYRERVRPDDGDDPDNDGHGALLLIGDPKQAIYGFRGGDIYAYLAAARAAGAARYTLTTNFRSTQGVLDAIEALYALPGHDPFVVPDIDFPHVTAGRTAGDWRLIRADGREQAALTFWQLHGNETELKNGKTKNPSKADDSARLIDETVAAIADLLHGATTYWQAADGTTRPVVSRDIAVLVNRHQEATALQAALAAAGIRAVCQHRESVFTSAEAADLRRILRAMAQPDDARAVRAAQPTALIGKRLADLVAIADDDTALQAAIEPFHRLHDAWRRRGVLAALEDLFVAAAPALLALTDGERRMSNWLQLGELLAHAESECFGMASLVRWLDDHITAAQEGTLGVADESQLRLESDADLVRIGTIHASKGLQYPIVFLPFAPWLGTAGAPDKPPLVFHAQQDDAEASQALIDLVGTDPANVQQAVIEARSEALRLLYVALTRAEQALIVGWREPDDYGSTSAPGDLLYRDGVAGGGAPARLADNAPDAIAVAPIDTTRPAPVPIAPDTQDADRLGPARSALPTPRKRWSTYSFSRLAHAPSDNAPAELPEPGAEDELTTPAAMAAEALAADAPRELPRLDTRLSGVRFGSAVHDLLENQLKPPTHSPWPEPGEPLADAQRRAVYDTLRKYGLIAENTADPRIDDTADLVARTLHTPLPAIGPLAGVAPGRMQTEMEFMLRLGGNRLGTLVDTLREAGYLPAALGGHPDRTLYGLMQGFIDLVVEIDGAYVILDYKTNRLGDTPAAYRDTELARAIGRAHYDLQYLIYTVALHRHLKRCLPDYDPATHLGGVQYLFVRAMDGASDTGVFVDRPDVALVEALDALFDGVDESRGVLA